MPITRNRRARARRRRARGGASSRGDLRGGILILARRQSPRCRGPTGPLSGRRSNFGWPACARAARVNRGSCARLRGGFSMVMTQQSPRWLGAPKSELPRQFSIDMRFGHVRRMRARRARPARARRRARGGAERRFPSNRRSAMPGPFGIRELSSHRCDSREGGASLTFPVGGSRNAQRRAGGNSRLSSARRAAGIPLARPRRLAFPRAQGNARGAGGGGPSWQGARRGEEDGGPPAPPLHIFTRCPPPAAPPDWPPFRCPPAVCPRCHFWPQPGRRFAKSAALGCAFGARARAWPPGERAPLTLDFTVARGARCVVRAPATPRPRRNEETLGFESWRPQLSRSLGFDAMSPARKLRGAIFQSWWCHVIMR